MVLSVPTAPLNLLLGSTCKYVFAPVSFTTDNVYSGEITVKNRNFFLSTDEYRYFWQLKDEDSVLQEGEIIVPTTARLVRAVN